MKGIVAQASVEIQAPASKVWDALGDERIPSEINDYIVVNLQAPGIYNNARYGNIEPQGDCSDPALDIIDFSVQVLAP